MPSTHDWWVATDDGVRLTVRVVPGARRSEIVGVVDGALKVKVAAPPVEGQANAEVERVIANWIGCRVTAVRILRGSSARTKLILIAGPKSHSKFDALSAEGDVRPRSGQ